MGRMGDDVSFSTGQIRVRGKTSSRLNDMCKSIGVN
jgi:hypothetical protein